MIVKLVSYEFDEKYSNDQFSIRHYESLYVIYSFFASGSIYMYSITAAFIAIYNYALQRFSEACDIMIKLQQYWCILYRQEYKLYTLCQERTVLHRGYTVCDMV